MADGHSLDGERTSVAAKLVPLLICVSPHRQDLRRFKTGILSTRSLTTLVFCFAFSQHWEYWVSGSKLGFLWLFFALDSRQVASWSHVANAVLVTVVPTVILQGNPKLWLISLICIKQSVKMTTCSFTKLTWFKLTVSRLLLHIWWVIWDSNLSLELFS